MITNIKKNLNAASFGNAVDNGIRVSVSSPAWSSFDFLNCVIFPGFFGCAYAFQRAGFF